MKRFVRRLRASAWVIAGWAAATFVLSQIGFFDHTRNAWFDAFSSVAQTPNADIQIVGIDATDFEDPRTFDGTLPLNREALASVIRTIAHAHPLVLAIDIQTSRPAFAQLWSEVGPALAGTPTVWVSASADEASPEACRQTWWTSCTYPSIAPLGGTVALDPVTDCRTVCAGSEILFADTDNVVRRYSRYLPTARPSTDGTLPTIPSFAWAVVGACKAANGLNCASIFDADRAPAEDDTESRLIRFSQLSSPLGWRRISIRDLQAIQHGQPDNFEPLHNHIVLLGGVFPDSRDIHPTPVGVHYGVEIWAQIIYDELHGGLREINEWQAAAADILCGILLVAIGAWLPFRAALVTSLCAIPVLCVLASWAAFSSALLWFNFIPMTASVFLHTFWEHLQIYERLRALHPEDCEEPESAPETNAAQDPPAGAVERIETSAAIADPAAAETPRD